LGGGGLTTDHWSKLYVHLLIALIMEAASPLKRRQTYTSLHGATAQKKVIFKHINDCEGRGKQKNVRPRELFVNAKIRYHKR
jgi:hypothetical protein